MTIGVDSSVIIAGVHANHPRHALAANWLVKSLDTDQLIVAHHSVLEAYAVLTRLPGELRVTPSEARDLLNATVQRNMTTAEYRPETVWALMETLVMSSVAGGRSYDAFILEILRAAGIDALATFNADHFRDLAGAISILDPAAPHD